MNNLPFGKQLSTLRKQAKLTNRKLAAKAKVPASLIGGLQSGNRCIGELQARRIGTALGLKDKELDSFILAAVNTCTEKVLTEAKDYPAAFLNMVARQLRLAGILPSDLNNFQINGDSGKLEAKLYLQNGRTASLYSTLTLAA